jgi:hypothetical protein
LEEYQLDVRLRVIPEPKPKTRAVLEPKVGEVLPVIKGYGTLNLLCGNCGAVLVEGIIKGQIRNMVILVPFADIITIFNNYLVTCFSGSIQL